MDTAVRAAIACAGAMIAAQVGGKAARDAIFLSIYEISDLPTMVIVAAFASIGAVFLTSVLMGRLGPGRVVPVAFILSAALLLGEWMLLMRTPRLAAPAVYLHLAVFGAFLISGFWSLVSERFDPRTAKKRIARIAAAATLGGLIGGVLAERVGAMLSTDTMLPVLALLHLVCAWLVLTLRPPKGAIKSSPEPQPDTSSASRQSGVKTLLGSSYLRDLALMVFLITVAANFLDYSFKSAVADRYDSGEALMRFFAIFYTVIGLITFLVQSTLGRTLLERIGLGGSAATLPLSIVAAGLGALLVPGLGSVAVARGSESVLRSSLFRSAYELFFTPVSPAEKRSTKTIIDVGCDRLGDAVGGSIVRGVLALIPQAAVTNTLLGLAMAAGGVAAFMVRRLHRGHVRALERKLLARAEELDLSSHGLGVFHSGVFETLGSVDLRQVMQAAGASEAALRAFSDTAVEPPNKSGPVHEAATTPAPERRDPLLLRIMELRSDDATRVRLALEFSRHLPSALVPHVAALLAWDEVCQDAIAALRHGVERHVGQLTDALLDPEEEFSIRRRIPRVLASAATERSIDGLLHSLADKRFEVRYRSGRALAHIHHQEPDLRISRKRVYAAVEREVAVDKRVWETHRLLDNVEEDASLELIDDVLRQRTNRSLEHVFTMLSLVLPAEPLRIAFRGLHTEDPQLRGTALEYLETVLPERIRDKLWPFVEEERRPAAEAQPADEILLALLRSSESIEINLAALRQAQDRTGNSET